MRAPLLAWVLAGASSALSGTGCLDPTQVTIDIRTAYPCGDTRTGIFVGGPHVLDGADAFTTTKETCLSDARVGDLVLVPSRLGEDVYVRIMAGVDSTSASTCLLPPSSRPGASCIEARRVVRFVPHRRLVLPIVLERTCINVSCPTLQTCKAGVCVNAIVTDPSCIDDPSTCDAGTSPSGPTWSACVGRIATYGSCAEYCASAGKACVDDCTTSRGYPKYGAEAWYAGEQCSDAGRGQQYCPFRWDDDAGTAPRWKCCCR